MLILIENGEVWAPEPRGRQSVLLCERKIGHVGEIERQAAERGAEAMGLEIDVIDASGCLVLPGLVDPHQHLIGGSGEEGFASRTPEIQLSEIVGWGITTVVGVLGVDATTRNLPALIAKVRGLDEEGITAFLYTGHYGIPPTTFTDSIRDDFMVVDKVIGVGEIAISDERAPQPEVKELLHVVVDAHVGGKLSGKAGVTHFHVGELPERLAPLRALIDDWHVSPELLYPSHVHRTGELLQEAVELSKRGCFVDMDAAQADLGRSIRSFLDQGGDPARLTLSSDADSNAPRLLWQQAAAAVKEHGVPLETLLPMVTANTAEVLRLQGKGRLEPGRDADVLVVRKDSMEIEHVVAKGRVMMRDRKLQVRERYLESSPRVLELRGHGKIEGEE